MSYVTRIHVDSTGAPIPKRWKRDRAPVIARKMLTALENHPDNQIPGESRPFLRRRQEDLDDALELYQSRTQAEARKPLVIVPELSEELLAILSAEALANAGEVDSAIDVRWRQVDDISRGFATRPTTPQGQAAAQLREHFFHQGRSFLSVSFERQYIENDTRLKTTDEALNAAAESLGVAPILDELRALNAHFGRLVGLTLVEEQPESPEDRATRALERVIQATWSAICAVWPGENSAHTEIRTRLLAPVLDELNG